MSKKPRKTRTNATKVIAEKVIVTDSFHVHRDMIIGHEVASAQAKDSAKSEYLSLLPEYDTIPLKPTSIAVSLQDNLVEYLNTLKFHLLFFYKPLALLSTSTFDYISEEACELVRRGKPAPTNVFGDDNLKGVNLIATDEWAETLAQCEPWHYDFELNTKQPTERDSRLHGHADEVMTKLGMAPPKSRSSKRRSKSTENKQFMLELGYTVFKNNLVRLCEVLQRCRTDKIPVTWGNDQDVYIGRKYISYLLGQYDPYGAETLLADIRRIYGSQLLRRVADWSILNLSTVPVYKILEFRKKNEDYLLQFWSLYREFLVAIELEPSELIRVVRKFENQIATQLSSLNSELALLRKNSEMSWIANISDKSFAHAVDGHQSSAWTFFGSPGLVAAITASHSNQPSSEAQGRRLQDELLARSSVAYLWKAKEEFG